MFFKWSLFLGILTELKKYYKVWDFIQKSTMVKGLELCGRAARTRLTLNGYLLKVGDRYVGIYRISLCIHIWTIGKVLKMYFNRWDY